MLEELGTISFAHLARSGFIAVSILRSASNKFSTFSKKIDDFQSEVKTISSRYTQDIKRLKQNQITEDDFLTLYGHLRPSSYNVYSETYRDSFKNIIPDKFSEDISEASIQENTDISESVIRYCGRV